WDQEAFLGETDDQLAPMPAFDKASLSTLRTARAAAGAPPPRGSTNWLLSLMLGLCLISFALVFRKRRA
ncbi:MAG: hypothetical protein ACPGGK_10245, partial [Pikeienuella sp.]